jgi:hypothetical protein
VKFVIPPEEIEKLIARLQPTEEGMEGLAFFAHQQIKSRHETQGESGGKPWPPKKIKEWGYDDGRAILTGPTGRMLNEWFSYTQIERSKGEAIVANPLPYSFVQEVGTVGKGGELPTIVPKKAKALFIPITDRARSAQRLSGEAAVIISKEAYGGWRLRGPFYHPTRGPRQLGTGHYSPLVKGRLKNGKLQKWDDTAGEYVDGIPDFIFLSKVDIPPRKQLPTSDQEVEAQVAFVADSFLNPQ